MYPLDVCMQCTGYVVLTFDDVLLLPCTTGRTQSERPWRLIEDGESTNEEGRRFTLPTWQSEPGTSIHDNEAASSLHPQEVGNDACTIGGG